MSIELKRAYDDPEKNDGLRVLVDRVWPRGIKKEDTRLDDWMKDIAPSDELRKWFGHDPEKWPEFCEKYFRELDDREDLVEKIAGYMKKGRVTLIFGAADREHNNAAALKQYLLERVSHSR
ncbi:MAG: DUF488 domain-containing protein [Desulfobulbaceae bacterium]|nr:DUF488 domain-containing protein [Desulfobulbaceae bacterium]